MTRRRWIADTWDDATATLSGSQALHLARVLRVQPGTEFDVSTGAQLWRAVTDTIQEGVVTFRLLEPISAPQTLDLSILLSVFKFDRFEWAVEKLTELGIAAIQPVLARRTEKHLAQASSQRVERWRRIALEAAKQSRRLAPPAIPDPIPLKQALTIKAEDAGAHRLRLVLSENEKERSLVRVLQSPHDSIEQPALTVAIGPEGGWTAEEETLFTAQAWTAVTLGPTILRAETAAIAAASVAAAWLNG